MSVDVKMDGDCHAKEGNVYLYTGIVLDREKDRSALVYFKRCKTFCCGAVTERWIIIQIWTTWNTDGWLAACLPACLPGWLASVE